MEGTVPSEVWVKRDEATVWPVGVAMEGGATVREEATVVCSVAHTPSSMSVTHRHYPVVPQVRDRATHSIRRSCY